MPTSAPRTLADQLRGWSDERLTALLEERPDLAVPAPVDSAQLAARAVVRTSVVRALDQLDRAELEVLLAVVQCGPVDAASVAGVVNASPDAVRSALERLGGLALIWGTPEALRAVSIVVELVGIPAGPDPDKVPTLLDEVDEQARAILEHLDETGTLGTVSATKRPDPSGTPSEQLLARGLLVARDERHVAVPWTVRLHLRGGRSTREPVDRVPEFATSPRSAELVDRAAAGAAFEFTHRTEMLLEAWSTRPPAGLRGGGLSVRDLRAAAELMHADLTTAALVIETAAAAQLLAVGMNDDLDAAWLPTDAYDGWLSRTGAQRWLRLAQAWLDNPRLVSAIGGRTGDKPVNALTPGLERRWLVAERRAMLDELAHLAAGETLAPGTGVASLLDRLRWRYPRRPAGRLDLVPTLLAEGASVGLLGLDGLSSYGRRLVSGPADHVEAVDLLDALLPAPVDHVLLQADLTAVAPGPLEQDFARRLSALADVESRGGATVYRFTTDSVRRAFDSGWSSVEVKDFLRASSRTPVPQALDYLVDDVSRRFGTLRVGVAESFLRSDDETALTELVHHAAAASLRLRRIAPTVLVSDVPLQVLLPRLRELGVAPVVEAADGTIRVARPEEYRSRTPRPPAPTGLDRARLVARASAVVAAIRAGDRAAASRPTRGPATSPADVITLLRTAAEDGSSVLIGYLDNHGTSTERLVRPREVGGGQLTAYDERSDDVRSFAVHRITRASLRD